MAETVNIARIAEKVSNEVFGVFGWERHPLRDTNWACAVPDRHQTQTKTHPSDLVLSYDDVYEARRIIVATDLKSYAKTSITKAGVAGAVSRLGMATECANLSEDFATKYVSDRDVQRWTAVGMLFVYNHDGEYSGDFDSYLSQIDKRNLKLPARGRMFVLGPHQIRYLYDVASDITALRGKQEIPFAQHCHFFYPDMVRTTTVTGKEGRAASLEMLMGPWQILRFRKDMGGGGQRVVSYVYYRDTGQSTDEFKYLFDYFFRYQLIEPASEIRVRAVPSPISSKNAAAIFENAKVEYAAHSHPKDQDEFKRRLSDVTFSTVEQTHLRFSDIELGMRDD